MKRFCLCVASLVLILMVALALPGCSGGSGTPAPAPDGAVSKPAASPAPQEEKPSGVSTGKDEEAKRGTLLYQGHGSLRITTPEGKVIYIDPYAGEGYNLPADLILVTHPHPDHTAVERIETQNPGCVTITHQEALTGGEHKTFVYDYATVEAVQAGNNPNHDINVCVGYIVTLSDGKSIYVSGDTSRTEQMAELAQRKLDYAFFCCDGRYNMDLGEAAECAALVEAKHSIPYHMAPGELFSRARAEAFEAQGRLIVADGEEITIE